MRFNQEKFPEEVSYRGIKYCYLLHYEITGVV